jgi:hypothetical protein
LYQVRDPAHSENPPECKRDVSCHVQKLLPNCSKTRIHINGSKKCGFTSLQLSSTPKVDDTQIASINVGKVDLIPTGDIRDGIYMTFSVKSNPLQVEFCGQLVPLNVLGFSNYSTLDSVKAVLSRTKLCRGVEGGKTLWTVAGGSEADYHGTVSKTCQLVLQNNVKVCQACTKHMLYIRAKNKVEQNVLTANSDATDQSASVHKVVQNVPTANSHANSHATDQSASVDNSTPGDSIVPVTEVDINEKLHQLSSILLDLGVCEDRSSLLVECVKNDTASHKYQRRWSSRYELRSLITKII